MKFFFTVPIDCWTEFKNIYILIVEVKYFLPAVLVTAYLT